MDNYRICPIEEEDFNQLIELFKAFASFEKVPERMINSVERMKEEALFFNGFVVKNNRNRICGYATYFFAYYTWTGKSLYMDDLYVHPSYRGQGLGSMLIQKVISLAKETKCHKLRWQVSEWNEPAIKFYESLGASIDHIEMNCDLHLTPFS